MPATRLERNAPCPCGSRRRYKHCCRLTQDPLEPSVELRRGTRIRCVTDWYAVRDRERLIARLEALPEVAGCAARGWSRIDLESGPFEPIAAVVLDEEGQIEVTTATELAAETTRWWLERVAGDLVEHLIGRVSAEEVEAHRGSRAPSLPTPARRA